MQLGMIATAFWYFRYRRSNSRYRNYWSTYL
jgi:hypothetical protein